MEGSEEPQPKKQKVDEGEGKKKKEGAKQDAKRGFNERWKEDERGQKREWLAHDDDVMYCIACRQHGNEK